MIYSSSFRGQPFIFCVTGVPNPRWALESFHSEADMRDAWWRIQPGDVVIDAGAGYGSYTLTALVAGAGLVIAAEPHKDVFFALCQNVAINKVAPGRFMALPYVLCDIDGAVVGFDPNTNSSIPRQTCTDHRHAKRIDALCAELDLPRLDWIKVDVDGMEVPLLNGALLALEKYRPRLIIENHDGIDQRTSAKVAELLHRLGYVGEDRDGTGVNDHWNLWTYPPKHGMEG